MPSHLDIALNGRNALNARKTFRKLMFVSLWLKTKPKLTMETYIVLEK